MRVEFQRLISVSALRKLMTPPVPEQTRLRRAITMGVKAVQRDSHGGHAACPAITSQAVLMLCRTHAAESQWRNGNCRPVWRSVDDVVLDFEDMAERDVGRGLISGAATNPACRATAAIASAIARVWPPARGPNWAT